MKEVNTGAILRPLTLLHSNDLHGDFLADEIDEKLLGGISMLSGYVSKVRQESPNVIYCIAGDMLQGSIIDSEFMGLSTIEIMNLLAPDIATIGNHEIDYGLAHLLFLERCARFPIVCANLFINNPYTRLFSGHEIMEINGMNVLFIGLITEEVLASIRQDSLLSTLVNVEDAAMEVGSICNAFRSTKVDLTVLLTHIGFEEDKQLASLLDPEWGVDIIIGGHSHTEIDHPELINGILVATAGHGSTQIGRFDLVVDTELDRVEDYTWELVPINSSTCSPDTQLTETVMRFKEVVDAKYDVILCKLHRRLTHPDRYQETALGNLVSDLLQVGLGVDVMMVGSGSIRQEVAGPIITKGGLMELMPFDDRVVSVRVSGAQFKAMVAHVLREEILQGAHGEFYQVSQGLRITYNRERAAFERFDFQQTPLLDDSVIRLGLQEYHYKNFTEFFAVDRDSLIDPKPQVLTTSLLDSMEEYLSSAQRLKSKVEGRLVVT